MVTDLVESSVVAAVARRPRALRSGVRPRHAVAVGILASVPGLGAASDVSDLAAQGLYCSATAQAADHACGHGVLDDYWIAVGICTNEPDPVDRKECFADANDARAEGNQLCDDQLDARREACDELGEARYDPRFEPFMFESDYANLAHANPYFPLGIGNYWVFRSAEQSIRVEVMNATKLIDEVGASSCVTKCARTGPSSKGPTTGSHRRRMATSGTAAKKPPNMKRSKATGRKSRSS